MDLYDQVHLRGVTQAHVGRYPNGILHLGTGSIERITMHETSLRKRSRADNLLRRNSDDTICSPESVSVAVIPASLILRNDHPTFDHGDLPVLFASVRLALTPSDVSSKRR